MKKRPCIQDCLQYEYCGLAYTDGSYLLLGNRSMRYPNTTTTDGGSADIASLLVVYTPYL
jgi:hypothetical protein